MKRLTKRNGKYIEYSDENYNDSVDNYTMLDKCLSKLADYEDAEEQGLLLRLPIAEGTEVFTIVNNTDACGFDCEHFVFGIDCYDFCTKLDDLENPQFQETPICENQFLEIRKIKTNIKWILANGEMLGKKFFLTKEEAKAALQAMKGGE